MKKQIKSIASELGLTCTFSQQGGNHKGIIYSDTDCLFVSKRDTEKNMLALMMIHLQNITYQANTKQTITEKNFTKMRNIKVDEVFEVNVLFVKETQVKVVHLPYLSTDRNAQCSSCVFKNKDCSEMSLVDNDGNLYDEDWNSLGDFDYKVPCDAVNRKDKKSVCFSSAVDKDQLDIF